MSSEVRDDIAATIVTDACRQLLSARSSNPDSELSEISDVWVTVAGHPSIGELNGHRGGEVRRLVAVATTYVHLFCPASALLLSDRFDTEALAWARRDGSVIVDVVDPDPPGGYSRFRIPLLQQLYRDCQDTFDDCVGIRVIAALAPTASRLMTSPTANRLSALVDSEFWPFDLPTAPVGGLR